MTVEVEKTSPPYRAFAGRGEILFERVLGWPRGFRAGIALSWLGFAVLLKAVLQHRLGVPVPYTLFFVPILMATILGGAGMGVAVTVSAAVLAKYFFVAPYLQLEPWSSRDGLFLAESLVLVAITAALRNALRVSIDRGRLLREAEARFGRIAQAAPVLLWLGGDDGARSFFGEAWLRFRGRTASEEMGFGWCQGLHPDDVPVWRAAFEAGVRRHEPFQVAYRVRNASGEYRWLLETGTPMPDASSGGSFVGSCVDITDLKRTEAELKNTQQALQMRLLEQQTREMQRRESLDVLAGGIAHDFNNLLHVVLGNVELSRRAASPSEAEVLLREAQQAAERAAELSRSMRAYTGHDWLSLAKLDMCTLVETHVPALQEAAGAALRVQVDAPSDIPRVVGDASRLRRVLSAVVTNAREAVGAGGGTVTLRLRVTTDDDPLLQDAALYPADRVGRYVVLEVEDNGPGMAPEVRNRMFDPFFTTKFPGRGLGLAAVYGVVRAHRGGLHVRSAVGAGTTVSLFFPVEPTEPTSASGPTASPLFHGTVLLVDDDAGVRSTTFRVLEALGFRVVDAADGRSALAVLRDRSTSVSVVLLDVVMPVFSGLDTFRAMRESGITLPVVFMSGQDDDEVPSVDGAADVPYLRKPFTVDALARALRRALRRTTSESGMRQAHRVG